MFHKNKVKIKQKKKSSLIIWPKMCNVMDYVCHVIWNQ